MQMIFFAFGTAPATLHSDDRRKAPQESNTTSLSGDEGYLQKDRLVHTLLDRQRTEASSNVHCLLQHGPAVGLEGNSVSRLKAT